ncbi:tetratricopeptide repeat protein [Sesbania bispinosa]|nr:tetratricopeptide repeat protein [Sesbania bispinosa]
MGGAAAATGSEAAGVCRAAGERRVAAAVEVVAGVTGWSRVRSSAFSSSPFVGEMRVGAQCGIRD